MANNNENTSKKLYVKALRQWVPVSDELYDAVYHDTNAFIRRQKYHKCCNCPIKQWWDCDMDCLTCKHHYASDFQSLDAPISDDENEEITLADVLPSDEPDICAHLEELELKGQLNEAIEKLNSLDRKICRLKMEGLSEREIAKMVGKSQSTINYHVQILCSTLREQTKDYI